MFKFLLFLLALGIAGLLFLQKKGFDPQALNPLHHPTPTPTPIETKAQLSKNIYKEGDCFLNSAENFGYVKITRFDNNTNLYNYRICNKYKPCLPEETQINFNTFEKTYSPSTKMECPPEVK